jgi:acetyl-CoA acyltransferase
MKTAVVAGCRTPFTRSGTRAPGPLRGGAREGGGAGTAGPRRPPWRGRGSPDLRNRDPRPPRRATSPGKSGSGCFPKTVPAYTVSRACASANQAIADGVNLIELGQADVVVAGGAESLSRIPITVSDRLAQVLMTAAKAKSLKDRVAAFSGLRPRDLVVPEQPAIAEPTTGESMGEAAERMAKENGISREAQDEWALRSHRLAAAAVADGRIGARGLPGLRPPRLPNVVEEDNQIRTDTSLEALAGLRPVFDRQYGSVTAGNASPLPMGGGGRAHERGRREGSRGRAPGLDPELCRDGPRPGKAASPGTGLCGAPGPRAGRHHDGDVELMEMHEAFAAQVLSNLQALDSDAFAREKLGRSKAVGHPEIERINVMGGSLSIGHPFGATGARLTTTLLNEMGRRDLEWGLLTVCAAGGLGFAMVLQRPEVVGRHRRGTIPAPHRPRRTLAKCDIHKSDRELAMFTKGSCLPVARGWAALLLLASLSVLLGGVTSPAGAQLPPPAPGEVERQEMLLPEAGVFEISAELRSRLGLFPDVPGFRVARLFRSGAGRRGPRDRIGRRGTRRSRPPRARFVRARWRSGGALEAEARLAGTRGLESREGRGGLVLGHTLLGLAYHGWAVPVAFDVDSSQGSVAAYLLTAGAAFYFPYGRRAGAVFPTRTGTSRSTEVPGESSPACCWATWRRETAGRVTVRTGRAWAAGCWEGLGACWAFWRLTAGAPADRRRRTLGRLRRWRDAGRCRRGIPGRTLPARRDPDGVGGLHVDTSRGSGTGGSDTP